MDKEDRIAIVLISSCILGYFLLMVLIIYKFSDDEKKAPQYNVGECYEIGNSGVSVAIKIEVTGFFGIYGSNIQNNFRVYARFNELKKSNQLDCDLVKKVYE